MMTKLEISLFYVYQAHAVSFLGVGIAYPGSGSRPRPSSNHTGSAKGARVEHGGEVLVLLPVIE